MDRKSRQNYTVKEEFKMDIKEVKPQLYRGRKMKVLPRRRVIGTSDSSDELVHQYRFMADSKIEHYSNISEYHREESIVRNRDWFINFRDDMRNNILYHRAEIENILHRKERV